MSHTPEPWSFVQYPLEKYLITTIEAGEETVIDDINPDDGKRIVACVNACAGAQTEDLERLGKDYVKPLIELIDRNSDLVEQLELERRDSLDCSDIEKLKSALSWMGVSTPSSIEECAARQKHLIRDLITAVLHHKQLKNEGGNNGN